MGGEAAESVTGDLVERADFDVFVHEEHDRLFKALYFVTGSREDTELPRSSKPSEDHGG